MGRCFAVDKATTVKKGRTDFNNFYDLLSPMVDVTFDLGNLAFVGAGGGNNASFCLAGASSLEGFGSIDHSEGIGEKDDFKEIFPDCCREDWLCGGLEKRKKNRRFSKKCCLQHTFQPVTIAKSIGA